MPSHDPSSERIIGCAFRVHSILGHGFSEKVYENAMAHELPKAGLTFRQQQGIEVWYDGVIVGQFMVDLLVEGKILVEIKAVKNLDDMHLAQGLNYLRATGLDVCLLLNFGGLKMEVRRLVPAPHWPIIKPVMASDEKSKEHPGTNPKIPKGTT